MGGKGGGGREASMRTDFRSFCLAKLTICYEHDWIHKLGYVIFYFKGSLARGVIENLTLIIQFAEGGKITRKYTKMYF